VRQRLARRGYEPDEIDGAVARLKEERAIDDARVAAAIARTETSIKRRGKLRVKRQIQSAGIASAAASRAIEETFAELDEDALLEAALRKRLRGRERAADDRELQRLYRFLVGQGFESDRISRALRLRRPQPGRD
jgi:regulatory protein